MAAEQGHLEAHCNIGDLYLYGIIVPKNRKKAFNWFMEAAEMHYPDAEYSVGHCYEYGYGVRKDIDEAIIWYEKAMNGGNYSAEWSYERLLKRMKGQADKRRRQ